MQEINKKASVLLCLHGGFLPADLSRKEIDLLTEMYGENWFDALGYTEPEYERPTK